MLPFTLMFIMKKTILGILIGLFTVVSCTSGKYPHRVKKTPREMKACDCPTFGYQQTSFRSNAFHI